MANPWFRLYSEFAHDPKVQMMSEEMQRRYIMLMCMRCSNVTETLHVTEIAFYLRISDAELEQTKDLFLSKGFIDDEWNLLNWDKRQFASDSSYERVKRHRAKRVENGLPQQNFIPKAIREKVFSSDGNACIYCGSESDLTIDHDIPQSRGGSDEIGNLSTACRSCNAAKRDLTKAEYLDRNVTSVTKKRNDNAIDTDKDKNINTLSGKPDDKAEKKETSKSEANQILDYLNSKTGKNYESVDANTRLIAARIKETSAETVKSVIDRKVEEWRGTDMDKYLRPATLFNAAKFASYSGDAGNADIPAWDR